MLSEELPHLSCNFSGMCFQREMAGVVEMNLRLRLISLERLEARRQEEGIVLPPNGQQRRTSLAEIGLELRIERYIVRVVEEQVELNLVIPGPGHQRGVKRVALRR